MRHKLIYTVEIGSLLLGFLTVGTFLFWSLYPYKPMQVNKSPIPVLTKYVKQGDVLIYELDYCKFTNDSVNISRSFFDGVVFSTPDTTTKNPIGCRIQNISIQVPETLPTGKYTLKISYTYKVNPIKVVTIEDYTEEFTVTR